MRNKNFFEKKIEASQSGLPKSRQAFWEKGGTTERVPDFCATKIGTERSPFRPGRKAE